METTKVTRTSDTPSTTAMYSRPYHNAREQGVVVIGTQPQLQKVLETAGKSYEFASLEPLETAYPKVDLESPDLLVLWLPIDEQLVDRTLWMLKLEQKASWRFLVTSEAA